MLSSAERIEYAVKTSSDENCWIRYPLAIRKAMPSRRIVDKPAR